MWRRCRTDHERSGSYNRHLIYHHKYDGVDVDVGRGSGNNG
jgi:hypothetical protein